MGIIKHSNIQGSALHDLKGVADASDNEVLTASSSSTSWEKVDADNFVVGALPFNSNYFQVQTRVAPDEQYATVAVDTGYSGRSSNSGTVHFWWDTVVSNTINGATLVDGVVSLPQGSYSFIFRAGSANDGALRSFGAFRYFLFDASGNSRLSVGHPSRGEATQFIQNRVSDNLPWRGSFLLTSTSDIKPGMDWRISSAAQADAVRYTLGTLNFRGNSGLAAYQNKAAFDDVVLDTIFWKLN